MSDAWRWEYDPSQEHVTNGLPDGLVTEVEYLASQLAELADVGVDIAEIGDGSRPGGLRRMDAAGGWFYFLAIPRDRLIVVVRVIPPFDHL
ncbi:hypothetical protein [Streptomyces oceani]|uniref:Type II toxin-antitoxin system RelE/ParE family toxin n=1 Tax=Streptomyces oceani TaxID=1075402 RepID=A0A1E7KK44_9ACTN|nr:hypothetical protein [Streptomyces oceani]OEV04295.1 hypothetical protein AN216_08890 [Streptomyces oceani]